MNCTINTEMYEVVKSLTLSDEFESFSLIPVHKGMEIEIDCQSSLLNKEELKRLIGDFYYENDFEYMGSFFPKINEGSLMFEACFEFDLNEYGNHENWDLEDLFKGVISELTTIIGEEIDFEKMILNLEIDIYGGEDMEFTEYNLEYRDDEGETAIVLTHIDVVKDKLVERIKIWAIENCFEGSKDGREISLEVYESDLYLFREGFSEDVYLEVVDTH